MVRCPTDQELEALLAGTASEEATSEVSLHIESCERCALRAEQCSGDDVLLGELRDVLEELPLEESERVPETLAGYEILGVLGRGGMGTVFEAEQSKPRRRVALKVLHPSLSGDRSLRRFELEGEVLGRLEHPGIARIHEAGTLDGPEGKRPYFALELVRGAPLVEWAESSKLNMAERVETFLSVCDAVRHAHQKGVIHRDLKPANVLVDREGRPRVLDFGIARTLDEAPGAPGRTNPGQMIGTLAYASPEQLRGDVEAHDTRTDVYGLGATLYELLTGAPPHDLHGLPLGRAVRLVEETTPTLVHERRPRIPEDLGFVVAKAMSHDPEDRYRGVAELEADLRRFLDDEPTLAHPPGSWTRARKWVRRNKTAAVGIAATLTALLMGVVTTSMQTRRARLAEIDAEARAAESKVESERARAAWQFLERVLVGSGIEDQRGTRTTVLKVLDEAHLELASAHDLEPPVEAALRISLGTGYSHLGLPDPARQELDRARRLSVELYGEQSVETAVADLALSRLNLQANDFLGAEATARRALDVLELEGDLVLEGDALTAWLAALNRLRRDDEARTALDRLLELRRSPDGGGPVRYANALHHAGHVYLVQGKQDLAGNAFEEAFRLALEHAGPEASTTRGARSSLSKFMVQHGKLEEAEELQRQGLVSMEGVFGPGHPRLAPSLVELAANLEGQGDHEEAGALYRRALALVGDGTFGYQEAQVQAAHGVAEVLQRIGKFEEAADAYRRAHELTEELHGPRSDEAFRAARNRARHLTRIGRHEDVIHLYEDLLRRRDRAGSPTPEDLIVRNNLASSLARLERFDEAAKEFRVVLDQKLANSDVDPSSVAGSRANLAYVLGEMGQLEEAERLAAAALATWSELHGPDHPRTAGVRLKWGKCLSRLGRFEEGERALRRGLRVCLEVYPEGSRHSYRLGMAWLALAQHLQRVDRLDEARDAVKQAERTLDSPEPWRAAELRQLEQLREALGIR